MGEDMGDRSRRIRTWPRRRRSFAALEDHNTFAPWKPSRGLGFTMSSSGWGQYKDSDFSLFSEPMKDTIGVLKRISAFVAIVSLVLNSFSWFDDLSVLVRFLLDRANADQSTREWIETILFSQEYEVALIASTIAFLFLQISYDYLRRRGQHAKKSITARKFKVRAIRPGCGQRRISCGEPGVVIEGGTGFAYILPWSQVGTIYDSDHPGVVPFQKLKYPKSGNKKGRRELIGKNDPRVKDSLALKDEVLTKAHKNKCIIFRSHMRTAKNEQSIIEELMVPKRFFQDSPGSLDWEDFFRISWEWKLLRDLQHPKGEGDSFVPTINWKPISQNDTESGGAAEDFETEVHTF